MSLLQTLNDPNVQKFITPIITGLIGILSGWAVNQLPPLQVANQGWQVLKLAIEAAIFAFIFTSWTEAMKAVSGNEATVQMAGVAYFVVLVFLGFAIADDGWRLVRKSSPRLEADREAARRRDRRQALMDNVRVKWIRGVLEKSLYQTARIELGMEERPEMVKLDRQRAGQERRRLPQGRRIFDEFTDLGEGGTLLILGAPGAGKTTQLLELARDLLDCTEAANSEQAVPAVLNLSSWGTVRGQDRKPITTLREWLIEELNDKYRVRREVGAAWVKDENLTLLLDGLDEVREGLRNECVEAINQFQRDHGATEIVVCSRVADYETLQNRFRFGEAVFILPLEAGQVEQYLQQAGTSLEGVRVALQQDQELQTLASQPLFLSILSLAYRGKSADELLNQSNSERLNLLFNRYIQRMFEQRQTDATTQKQMKRWLSIIARQMGSEKEFLIERMQPRKWLHHFTNIRQYRLLSGIIFGLIGGLIVGLTIGLFTFMFIWTTEGTSFIGSVLSLVFGLARILVFSLAFGFVSGLVCGLVFWLTDGIAGRIDSIDLVEALQISIPNEVRQKILNQLNQWLPIGLIFGSIIGLFFGLIVILNSSGKLIFDLFFNLFFGWLLGLPIGLLIGLFSGLISILKTDIRVRTHPNKGIWDSFNNVLLLCGVAFILTLLLLLAIIYGLLPIIGSNRTLGMLVSVIYIPFLVAFLSGGGLACIQHFTLRLVLYRAKRIPWNFVTFFQQAEERLFIQRTGGSYIFIHRYLQEHFANIRD